MFFGILQAFTAKNIKKVISALGKKRYVDKFFAGHQIDKERENRGRASAAGSRQVFIIYCGYVMFLTLVASR